MDNVKMVKRRKIIAWTAALVIVLPFVLWCLLPVPTFGYADNLYDMAPQPLELIEGGDLFDIYYCGVVSDRPLFRIVPKKEDVSYTISDAVWLGDQQAAPGRGGTFSVKVNGKWEEPISIAMIADEMPRGQDYCLPTCAEGGGTWILYNTITEYSGRLRFTLYFRECIRSKLVGAVSSVGDRLSATFELDMPKPSRSMFDVYAFTFAYSNWGQLYIRNNTGENIQLWLDRDSFLLEKKEESGGYTEVMRGYHDSYYDNSEPEPRYIRPVTGPDRTMYLYQFDFYEKKPDPGDYRLTLGFNTEKDGSGDCYTLTLKLRLHEQGSLLRG